MTHTLLQTGDDVPSLTPLQLASDVSMQTASQPMTAARQRAYRRFALTVLGADLPTLTADLRARRLASPLKLRLVQPLSRAA
ncbi:MAG TPA: hypothetical protein VGQ62_24050 [Chloroflexota bacterium]|jgi:hypothetical protein|nr:hypothetical protein [Chloroflexota bacterium]